MYTPAQQKQKEAYRVKRLNEEGYNADGTLQPWAKLATNKTWTNFANNIALPMASYAAGDGAGKIAAESSLLLLKSFGALSKSEGAVLKEIEASIPGAHFYSRHGAGTTLGSQYLRAISGLAPDMVATGEVNASRFLTDKIQLKALKIAEQTYAATGERSFSFSICFIFWRSHQ